MHNFLGVNNHFPAGQTARFSGYGDPPPDYYLPGWAFEILPFIEQDTQFRNQSGASRSICWLVTSPSDLMLTGGNYRSSFLVGNVLSGPGLQPPSYNPSTNTVYAYDGGWNPGTVTTIRYRPNTVTRLYTSDGLGKYCWNKGINSAHVGGANVLRCDGSVTFVNDNIAYDTLKYLCIIDDGIMID